MDRIKNRIRKLSVSLSNFTLHRRRSKSISSTHGPGNKRYGHFRFQVSICQWHQKPCNCNCNSIHHSFYLMHISFQIHRQQSKPVYPSHDPPLPPLDSLVAIRSRSRMPSKWVATQCRYPRDSSTITRIIVLSGQTFYLADLNGQTVSVVTRAALMRETRETSMVSVLVHLHQTATTAVEGGSLDSNPHSRSIQ